jgi:hypothetical protein
LFFFQITEISPKRKKEKKKNETVLEGFNRQKSPTKRHISMFGFQFVTNNIEHGWMIKDLVLSFLFGG